MMLLRGCCIPVYVAKLDTFVMTDTLFIGI